MKILHADYIAFICFVWISEQTVAIYLYIINKPDFYNRSGECLLRGTN